MTRRNQTFVLALAAAAVCARAATAQPKADQYYYLENKNSGKFVCTGQTDNGVQVKLWGPIPEGQEDRCAFKLVESEEKGYFYLIHKLSGKYICSEADNGDPVHLWGPIPEGDVDHYLFKLKAAGGGYNYLIHKSSGKYVCSVDSRENGAAIVIEGPIPDGADDRFLFHFSKAAEGRNYWRDDKGHFENTKGNLWERKNADSTFHFVETDRTDAYVELYDKSRDTTVRLYSDRCMFKAPSTDNKFEKYSEGHWGGN